MATLNPTVCRRIKIIKMDYAGTTSWDNHIPDTATSADSVNSEESHNVTAIYFSFGYAGATITLAEARNTLMSFDTSGITSTLDSATLTVYGHTNTATDSEGIICLKTTLASTTSIEVEDWGRIDLGGAGPTVYTDAVTDWEGGTATANTFNFNSTALTDMVDNDEFQLVIVHKWFYDNYDANPPFAFGNNSPSGTDQHGKGAGMYYLTDASYQPVLTYSAAAVTPPPSRFNIKSGKVTINSGKLTIK